MNGLRLEAWGLSRRPEAGYRYKYKYRHKYRNRNRNRYR
jgi:hypothetical protein